jgi:DNA-binding transcriptional MerR regulator
MQQRASRKKETVTTVIPDKLYFRIGEVAKLCRVEAYVLRFWESEFPQLKPNKSGTGQRLYRKRDVELALRIKRLLHEQGYTIAGARSVLQSELREGKKQEHQPELPLSKQAGQSQAQLQRLRTELKELLGILSSDAPAVPRPQPRPRKVHTRNAPNLFGE